MASEQLNILLLEDTDSDAELVERALLRAQLDYSIRRAQTEDEFVRGLREMKPHIVLADYKLPSFDGLSALRIVREQSPDLPFIIVSGTLGDEKAVEVLKLGATDYVLKDRLSRLAPAILRALKEIESQVARRRAQEQFERAIRLDSLGRVAATMAHEMNNVLMGIQFAAIRLRATTDPKGLRLIDEQIELAVRRGQRITDEVARFTTPAEPAIEVVNIAAWLNRFAVDLRGHVGSKIELALTASRDNLIAHADLSQLEQVLTNLVTNARDAMPGGGRIEISAIDESKAGLDYIEIAMRDTGTGMTPEVMTHIFEPLFTTKRIGTGLGLAVSYQMVLAQGGQMFAESKPGVGSIFHVLLPRAPIRGGGPGSSLTRKDAGVSGFFAERAG